MEPACCPDRGLLELLILGKVNHNQAEGLELHLLKCAACASQSETIHAVDELLVALRHRRTIPEDPGVIDTVIERGKGLVSRIVASSSLSLTSQGDLVAGASSESQCEMTLRTLRTLLSPAESPDELGRLGGYRVIQILGAGGMGIVVQAEDPRLKRRVALKLIHPASPPSAATRERFFREAQCAASMEHDNIVPIFQIGEERNIPFIAMPLLRGETLKGRLERVGRLPMDFVIKIALQVAAGLEVAHNRGLIHRDIKPENIWLEEGSDRVRILDFGLAREAGTGIGITLDGTVVGTPQYMSPEQAAGLDVDHRSDLYSLGCVLYTLLTGRAPHERQNVLATIAAVLMDEVPALEALVPGTSIELNRLVHQLLCKSPNDRPATATEVIARLEEIETKWKGNDYREPAAGPVLRADPERRMAHNRFRLYNLGAFAVLVAIIGVLAVWFLPPKKPDRNLAEPVAAMQGGLIVSESFDYAVGSLARRGSNGTGWSGAWSGPTQRIDSPGLTYTDDRGLQLQSAGNCVQPHFGTASLRSIDLTSNSLAERFGTVDHARRGLGRDETTIWLSFLARGPSIAPDAEKNHLWSGILLLDGAQPHGDEALFLGKTPESPYVWGVGGSSIGKYDLTNIPTNQNVLFVTAVEFDAGLETVRVWINPGLRQTPSLESSALTLTARDFRFDKVRIAGSDLFHFDELRIGTSFASVTPVSRSP